MAEITADCRQKTGAIGVPWFQPYSTNPELTSWDIVFLTGAISPLTLLRKDWLIQFCRIISHLLNSFWSLFAMNVILLLGILHPIPHHSAINDLRYCDTYCSKGFNAFLKIANPMYWLCISISSISSSTESLFSLKFSFSPLVFSI